MSNEVKKGFGAGLGLFAGWTLGGMIAALMVLFVLCGCPIIFCLSALSRGGN